MSNGEMVRADNMLIDYELLNHFCFGVLPSLGLGSIALKSSYRPKFGSIYMLYIYIYIYICTYTYTYTYTCVCMRVRVRVVCVCVCVWGSFGIFGY